MRLTCLSHFLTVARHPSLYCNGDVEQKTRNPLGEYRPAPTSTLNAALLIINQNRRALLRVYVVTTSEAS